jgi:hypothetical protein
LILWTPTGARTWFPVLYRKRDKRTLDICNFLLIPTLPLLQQQTPLSIPSLHCNSTGIPRSSLSPSCLDFPSSATQLLLFSRSTPTQRLTCSPLFLDRNRCALTFFRPPPAGLVHTPFAKCRSLEHTDLFLQSFSTIFSLSFYFVPRPTFNTAGLSTLATSDRVSRIYTSLTSKDGTSIY